MSNPYTDMARVRRVCKECGTVHTVRVWNEEKMCLACKKKVAEACDSVERVQDGGMGPMERALSGR